MICIAPETDSTNQNLYIDPYRARVLWTVLQANESGKAKSRLNSSVDTGSIQAIRSRVPGNSHCADCDAASMYLTLSSRMG
jgi:hypothetical protein